jgi:flagella basal body P-ring formation protein FlgA
VRILVKSARVVAAEPLHAQHPIEASQLRLETYEGFPLRIPPLGDIAQAVGRIPRRSLAAGTALAPGDLDTPYDVARGDSVRVEVSHGEAHLELDGRAEASGRRGQTIPVLNPANGRKFSARVEGAGRVSVGTHP